MNTSSLDTMASAIPKVVYQTWKTKNLPAELEAMRQRMISTNPEYTFMLFDDAEMDDWIRKNTDENVQACYFQLAVGAAKADLWRYLILYNNGGIYLDIDSLINCPIREFIRDSDEAVISREKNKGFFLQWFLIFKPEHPVLKATIEVVLRNIRERSETNIALLTGPGPFTDAIQEYYINYLPVYRHMWYISDDDLNTITNARGGEVEHCCRFKGVDFDSCANWKCEAAKHIYDTSPHWTEVSTIFTS